MRKSRLADFGACAICRLVSMRSIFSGITRSSGPSLVCNFAAKLLAGQREIGDRKPSLRKTRAGDRIAVAVNPRLAPGAQHDVERHRQPRRDPVRRRAGSHQPIDQADFAASGFIDESAVHAVDDAREREARIGRSELRAVEQLEVKGFADADALGRELDLVPLGIAVELGVDRGLDRRHRRPREQPGIVEWKRCRARRFQDAAEAKSSAIEFTQSAGVDDRCTPFQCRVLRGMRRQSAACEGEHDNEEPQREAHVPTNTVAQRPIQAKRRLTSR